MRLRVCRHRAPSMEDPPVSTLPRKFRKRDLITLGEAPSLSALNQRIMRGQFPPPDLHDPVDGAALWLEPTIAAHRGRELAAPPAPNVGKFPSEGLAIRARNRASRLTDGGAA